uniref:Uncharacterized protein n=1 Tax=Coccidioides posadasii RMSCC 3488 TaxID=454284 RepID=A0A0J6F175_COCPO|nr:hypothetical protein CPAG_00187 [Coccidioides posadasii RMSCC 3488]
MGVRGAGMYGWAKWASRISRGGQGWGWNTLMTMLDKARDVEEDERMIQPTYNIDINKDKLTTIRFAILTTVLRTTPQKYGLDVWWITFDRRMVPPVEKRGDCCKINEATQDNNHNDVNDG